MATVSSQFPLRTPVAGRPASRFTDWRGAVREYLLHVEAHRAHKTALFYRSQLTQLVLWAEDNQIDLETFGKRHLDRYLVERSKTVSRTTMHHDGVAAKAFFKWSVRNDLLDRNPASPRKRGRTEKAPVLCLSRLGKSFPRHLSRG